MEQNIFPKKIKIAIFLMIASGILPLGQFVYTIGIAKIELNQITSSQYNIFSLILANFGILLIPVLFIVFAYFLKKKKKWAWFAAMVLLLKEIVIGIQLIPLFLSGQIFQLLKEFQAIMLAPIFTFFIIDMIISVLIYILILISLIFLTLERKKYWQIAS